LERKLHEHRKAVEFTGGVPMDVIPEILSATDVCIFPSLWENFPFVCLESMAAARGIVASNAGGMKDMLKDGDAGRLIPPGNADAIAEALIELVGNEDLRMQLGEKARRRLLNEYNVDRIGALQEASYIRAKARRLGKGSRASRSDRQKADRRRMAEEVP
jgi:glycosyltransferase involved in cell wall biosynthesis